MMPKEEFYEFLKANGGLVSPESNLPYPISIFGIECDDGWLELIADLIRDLSAAGWTREIKQIKEKFGGLCFYAGGLTETMANIIVEYKNRSYSICEVCGSKHNVSLRGTTCVKTLCDQCTGPWLERQNRISNKH